MPSEYKCPFGRAYDEKLCAGILKEALGYIFVGYPCIYQNLCKDLLKNGFKVYKNLLIDSK